MTGKWTGIWRCAAAAVLLLAGGCATPWAGREHGTSALEYRLQVLRTPRPNRAHILRVDLAQGRVQPAVVIAPDPDGAGPASAALTTPLRLARDRSVLAFINANPWEGLPTRSGRRGGVWYEGQPVSILGLAVNGWRRAGIPQPGTASVWIDPRGRMRMDEDPAALKSPAGMAGFQQIVRDGELVAPSYDHAVHPRTAIGVDQGGRLVSLVVVDGRQKGYSEGLSLCELGHLMLSLGCHNAVNLDGGGSSVMGVVRNDGRLHIVNSPSDRIAGISRIRPLPVIFAIKRRE